MTRQMSTDYDKQTREIIAVIAMFYDQHPKAQGIHNATSKIRHHYLVIKTQQ